MVADPPPPSPQNGKKNKHPHFSCSDQTTTTSKREKQFGQTILVHGTKLGEVNFLDVWEMGGDNFFYVWKMGDGDIIRKYTFECGSKAAARPSCEYSRFFFRRFGKNSRGKNSNSRNFLQKLKQKTQEIGKFDPKRVKTQAFSSKNSLFPRKTRISSKNSRIFEKLKQTFSKNSRNRKVHLQLSAKKRLKNPCIITILLRLDLYNTTTLRIYHVEIAHCEKKIL